MAAFDEARRLLAKAGDDEYVLDRLLDDAAAPDSMFGFHAQQAVEKLLKAALFAGDVPPPRTHQLTLLIDLASERGLQPPPECEALRGLTPFAVLYRYDDVESGDAEEPLPRAEVRMHIRRLRSWVEGRLTCP